MAADFNKLQSIADLLQQTYMQTINDINGGQGAEHMLLGSHALKLMQGAASLPQLVGKLSTAHLSMQCMWSVLRVEPPASPFTLDLWCGWFGLGFGVWGPGPPPPPS